MATGLATASISIRNSLSTRNYYNPTSVYDVNITALDSAVNALAQYTPFNLKGNFLVTSLGGQTPITISAQSKQVSDFSLNLANKVIQGQIPVKVQGTTILQQAGNVLTGNYSKFRDLSLTDKNKLNDNIITSFSDVINATIGNDFGYSESLFEKVYAGLEAGSNRDVYRNQEIQDGLYDLLGQYTKDTIVSFNNENFYGNRRSKGVNRTNIDLNVSSLLNYTYFNFNNTDTLAVRNYISGDGSRDVVRPTISNAGFKNDNVNEFLQSTTSNFTDQDIAKEYGYGSTDRYNSNTGQLEPRLDIFNSDKTLDGSDGSIDPKRGLLHLTKQIMETKIGHELASDNITYTTKTPDGKDIVHFKGRSECRSWTNKNQYGSDLTKSLLTWNQNNGGNGVEGSTMKDSVTPKIYIKATDTNADKRRLMFSFENLAFDTDSYNSLPKSEQGPFGGRQMWFAPYGIDFSENHNADWQSTSFVGRPEKVYNYTGVERTGTLSFMLLMDYPMTDYKLDLIDYSTMSQNDIVKIYNGCDILPSTPLQNSISTNKPDEKPIETKTSNTDLDILKNLNIYFDNNSNTINTSYNPNNLNDNYINQISNIRTLVKKSTNHKITIVGKCSSLWLADYNAQLGYRRAYALLNSVYSGNLKAPDNFVDSTFVSQKVNGKVVPITQADVAKTTFTFTTTDNSNLTFIIGSVGEKDTLSGNEITTKRAIESRNANVSNVVQSQLTQSSETITVNKTSSEVNQGIIQNQNNDNKNNGSTNGYEVGESPNTFKKDQFPTNSNDGFYLDKFIPTNHSQTPFDFHTRLTFLAQCLRPGKNINTNPQLNNGTYSTASNSIFGKTPVIVFRYGDFIHSKILIKSMDIKYEKLIDINPNGHGVQPMVANVTLSIIMLGSQSLETPIAALNNAISYEYYANSSYNLKNSYNPYVNYNSIKGSVSKEQNQLARYSKTITNFNK